MLALLLAFAAPLRVRAAAGHVQAATGNSASSAAPTLAFGSNVTAGNIIAGAIVWNSTTITLTSVTDSLGNSYTLVANPTTQATLGYRGAMFYALNVTGGAATLTFNLSGAATSAQELHEISGVGLYDGGTMQAQDAVGTGANAITSGSITTTAAGDYIFGVSAEFSAGGGYTAGTTESFVLVGTGTNPSGGVITGEWAAQSAAGSVAATFTKPSGGSYTLTGVMAFKSSAAVALSGTVTASIAESDIVAGGKTIVLTATGDTFVPASSGAITYVGGQINGFAGTTSAQTITFSLTGGVASTPAAGDFVLITYAVGSTANRSLAIRNTGATDYTLVDSELYQDDTFDTNLRVAYRFMPGTPETQFVLTETVTGGTGNAADAGRYIVQVFRGVDTGTPLEVAAVPSGNINGSGVDLSAIVPSTAGTYVVGVGAAASTTGSTMTSGDLSDFRAGSTVDTNDISIGGGYFAWTSGSFNPAAWGNVPAGTTANSWAGMTVALRPLITTPFANARAAIRDGCDSAQAEGTGWDALKSTTMPVANVVRTSGTVVTITLAAAGTYDITAQETIACTVPGSALTGGSPVAATPSFTVSAGGGGAPPPCRRSSFGLGCGPVGARR